MKLCLVIFLASLIFIEAHGSRVKRGLTADEQKKFLDELNKDRNRVAKEEGIDYVPAKYDASLEKKIVPGKTCFEYRQHLLPLQYNDVAEQLRKHYMAYEGDDYQSYFHPNSNRIACSKEFKCTQVLMKHNDIPLELQGKTIEYHGVCVQGSNNPEAKPIKLTKAKTPSPNKYGDILGIPALSGTGSVFSIIISLFLVFYI
ncbi:unnamed protein product [Caenorhabditis brenneri]